MFNQVDYTSVYTLEFREVVQNNFQVICCYPLHFSFSFSEQIFDWLIFSQMWIRSLCQFKWWQHVLLIDVCLSTWYGLRMLSNFYLPWQDRINLLQCLFSLRLVLILISCVSLAVNMNHPLSFRGYSECLLVKDWWDCSAFPVGLWAHAKYGWNGLD